MKHLYVNGINYDLVEYEDGLICAYLNKEWIAGAKNINELQSKLCMIEKVSYRMTSLFI